MLLRWLHREKDRRRGLAGGRLILESLEARVVPTNLPPGFTETLFASGVGLASCMAFAPDGRLFVCEKDGDLRVIQADGTVSPRPFLHVNVNDTNEYGLLGVAFDPQFAVNRYVYVYYTVATTPIHCRVSRFTASLANPNVAEFESEQIVLQLDNLSSPFSAHVGGSIHFGLDGKLYVAVGEDENGANAQNPGNLLGKMLRINPDGSVPPDNPFVNVPGARGEIYAFGFRNPFRFAVRPTTGTIYVNDVGSGGGNAREEVNQLFFGANYGWPIFEGNSNDPDFADPLHIYAHGTDPDTGSVNCAITGATFYGPGAQQFPRSYAGDYFFADLCGGWIRRRDWVTGEVTVFASDTAILPVDLAVNSQGSLFYLNFDGQVYRIDYTGAPAPGLPPVSESPDGFTVAGQVSAEPRGIHRMFVTGSEVERPRTFVHNSVALLRPHSQPTARFEAEFEWLGLTLFGD
jgi:glucose/arabinose dehydrogenase